MRKISVLAALAAIALTLRPAAADAPSIAVNGTTVTFDQPPVVRAGRVFVPLRGVFERLGATVVYQNGTINATSGARTVSLQIGSTNALVNGSPQMLDVPPFLIGARTLVPLRFISQALGATVQYDAAAQAVYVNGPPPSPVAVRTAAPQPPLTLLRTEPAAGSTIRSLRPQIAATFAQALNPDSVRVRLDGRDVTAASYIADRSFVYDPAYDVPAGTHTVAVTGKTPAGVSEARTFSFVNAAPVAPNFLRGLAPANGTRVGSPVVVAGYTRPNARVRIVAISDQRVLGFNVNAGTTTIDTTANGNGYFRQAVGFTDFGSGVLDVRVSSLAADGGSAAATLRLRT